MTGKSQSLAENIAGNLKAKSKHCPALISVYFKFPEFQRTITILRICRTSLLCLPEQADALNCWKCHDSKYSSLSKLTSNFLCIPVSSASVERTGWKKCHGD